MSTGDLPRHTVGTVKGERPKIPIFDQQTGQEYQATMWCFAARPQMAQLVYYRFWRGERERCVFWEYLAEVASALNNNTPITR